MRWPQMPSLADIAKRAGLPAAAAGGGYVATILAAPKTAEAIILGVVLASATLGATAAKIVEAIWRQRRANIKAHSDAKTAEQLTKKLVELVDLAVSDPTKLELVKDLMHQVNISPLLPPDRRMADQWLAPKLVPPRSKGPLRQKLSNGSQAGEGAKVMDFPLAPPDNGNPSQPKA